MGAKVASQMSVANSHIDMLQERLGGGQVQFRLTVTRQESEEAGAPGYATVIAGRCAVLRKKMHVDRQEIVHVTLQCHPGCSEHSNMLLVLPKPVCSCLLWVT